MAGSIDEKGQLAVEFAVVAPILIALGLIIFDLSHYLYLTGKFDHVCRQTIVSQGVSPEGNETSSEIDARVKRLIENEFKDESRVDITLTSSLIDSSGAAKNESDLRLIPFLKRYNCTLSYSPIFARASIGTIRLDAPLSLKKSVEVVIDPYRAGIWV